jgi:aminopeptidase N
MRIAAVIVLCSLSLAACGGSSGAEDASLPDGGLAQDAAPDGTPLQRPIGFEVPHYDYTFDLATRQARSVVSLDVTTGGNCVSLPFLPTAAHDVALGGAPADPVTVADGQLTACSPGQGFAAGETITLDAAFEVPQQVLGSSQIGFSARWDLEGNRFYYLLSWFEGCDRFGPCDPRPGTFATYRFTVTHPAGLRVFCPGVVTAGATTTFCDFPHAGGPTYSTFAIAASASWEEHDLGTFGGVHLLLYDEPQSGIAAKLDPVRLGGFLSWMQTTFGPYPFGAELRYVIGATYWWGFEHPGNIVLSNSLGAPSVAYADDLHHCAMHETAHMWAGDQVTLAATRDFAWKEALTEYLTFVYEDETIGAVASQVTAAYWKDAAAVANYYPVPGDGEDLFATYSDAYGAGPLIFFRQLEVMYGRDAVMSAIGAVLGSPRTLSVEQLQAALEAATGASLAGYFDAWLRGTGAPAWPSAHVTTSDAGGGAVTVTVALTTADSTPRGCAFHVRLKGAGDAFVDVAFDAGPDGTALLPATVTPGFTVTATEVDPLNECLVLSTNGKKAARRVPRPWIVER